MSIEYQYKRYQLNLDASIPEQRRIIDFLDGYKAGKQRNSALIGLVLSGLGENVNFEMPVHNAVHNTKTEDRLDKMERLLEELLKNSVAPVVEEEHVNEDKTPAEEVVNDILERATISNEIGELLNPLSQLNTQEEIDEPKYDDVFIPDNITDFLNNL